MGSWTLCSVDDSVLEYERRHGDDVRRVLANFGAAAVQLPRAGWELELGARRGPGAWDGRLDGEDAVILRPTRR